MNSDILLYANEQMNIFDKNKLKALNCFLSQFKTWILSKV